jgi:hypothetical protein
VQRQKNGQSLKYILQCKPSLCQASSSNPPISDLSLGQPSQLMGYYMPQFPNAALLCKSSLLSFQNPKLSNKELDSGSSNTLGGALCPPSTGSFGIGRSATTSELRLRSIVRGSGPPKSLKTVGAGRRNSQLRTVGKLAF